MFIDVMAFSHQWSGKALAKADKKEVLVAKQVFMKKTPERAWFR